MAGDPEVIFYDIPSNGRTHSWGPNTWKTRAALNYKRINYKTEWVEYPDIEPKFKELGIPANGPNEFAPYTCPAIQIVSTGEYIMDSKKIAPALEKLKPEPSFHLDDPIIAKVDTFPADCILKMRGNVFPNVPPNLPDRSAEYFRTTRHKRFGLPLEELAKKEGGKEYYEKAKPVLQNGASLLEAKDGPFLAGSEFGYGDIYILAFILFMKNVNAPLFEEILKDFPALKRLYEGAAEKNVFDRDD